MILSSVASTPKVVDHLIFSVILIPWKAAARSTSRENRERSKGDRSEEQNGSWNPAADKLPNLTDYQDLSFIFWLLISW